MPARSRRYRKREISRGTQNWINYLQHDIGNRTSESQTIAIITIAFGGATSYLVSTIVSTFSLSIAISLILVVFVGNVGSIFMATKIAEKGRTSVFWKYALRYLKIFILIFIFPAILGLIFYILFLPVFLKYYFFILMVWTSIVLFYFIHF